MANTLYCILVKIQYANAKSTRYFHQRQITQSLTDRKNNKCVFANNTMRHLVTLWRFDMPTSSQISTFNF